MKFLLLVFVASFAGCSVFQHGPQQTAVQACAAYNAAIHAALQARVLGKLNNTQINQITQIDNAVTPICTSSILTTNQTLITSVVTAGVRVGAMTK